MLGFLLGAFVGGGKKYVITIGTSGNSAGWDNSGTTFGSISPDDGNGIALPNSAGNYINAVYTVTTGGADLTILSDTAGLAQDAWTSIYVQDGTDGDMRRFNSADAGVFSDVGQTLWAFGDGTDDVYDLADSGNTSLIIIT